MNAAGQRRLTPLLVLLAAILGAVLLMLLLGVGRAVHWNALRPAAPLPPPPAAMELPPPSPLAQFAVIWERPLFNPDRKPIAAAAENHSVGDLTLTGIIITPTLRIALLHDKSNNRDLQVRQGAALPGGGWTLAEVQPRAVLFDAPSGRVELKLPAGAPITTATSAGSGAAAATPADNSGPPPPSAAPASPAGASSARMGVPANAARRRRPPQTDTALQAERLQRLKSLIQKRRAEQTAQPTAGEH